MRLAIVLYSDGLAAGGPAGEVLGDRYNVVGVLVEIQGSAVVLVDVDYGIGKGSSTYLMHLAAKAGYSVLVVVCPVALVGGSLS